MKKTPSLQVKEGFGSKDKLVEELLNAIQRPSSISKDELKKKLKAQSNKKLLNLLNREKLIKERFGSREKLIDALVTAKMGKGKKEDKDYRKRLNFLTAGQLVDLARRLQVSA